MTGKWPGLSNTDTAKGNGKLCRSTAGLAEFLHRSFDATLLRVDCCQERVGQTPTGAKFNAGSFDG